MTYDELLMEADTIHVTVKEKDLYEHDGLTLNNRIAIRKTLTTNREKNCVLAEELGHIHTTVGNILDLSNTVNYKQELKARNWGYNKLIGLQGIINSFNARCTTTLEMAEYLDITEEYLQEALEYYRNKYGIYTRVDNYTIMFEPYLSVTCYI